MKWLPKKVHEKGLDLEQFQKSLGISARTAQVYLIKGIVPPETRYRAIASVLGIEPEEVYDGFKNQMISEGKERICKECDAIFIGFKVNQIYCSENCRIEGSKRINSALNREIKTERHWKNNPLQLKTDTDKSEKIGRDELDEKISTYLMNGNTIENLPDEPDQTAGYGASLQHKMITVIDTAV